MKDKKQSLSLHQSQPNDKETFFVASTCDCTGLIPSLPTCEEDIDSYQEIYHVPDQGSRENFKPQKPQQ